MRVGWYSWKFFWTTRPLSIVICPGHQVAHAFDEAAVHQVLGLARVDDLAADVDRTPRAVDLDRLVRRRPRPRRRRRRSRNARTGTPRPCRCPSAASRGCSSPTSRAPPRARRARAPALKPPTAPGADRVVQQVDPVLQRILAGGDGDLVDEALLHERDAVGRRRAQRPDGNAERRHVRGVDQKFATKPRGNSLAGTTEFVLATKSRIRDQLAGRVQAGLEEVEARRAGTGRARCRLRATTAA